MDGQATTTLVMAARDETDLAALVPDRAPSHRTESVRAVGLSLLEQPSPAPEFDPAERVFEHLRAGIEGRIYPSIAEKLSGVDAMLQDLDADPARVQPRIGWQWIRTARPDAPADYAARTNRIGIRKCNRSIM